MRARLRRAVFTAKCLVLVAAVRLGLTLLSYKVLRRWTPKAPPRAADEARLRRTAWGVTRAAALVPGATCLTQALAAQVMLARAGFASDIRIGVRRDDQGVFRAHAWLLSEGRVVLGGDAEDLAGFSVLTDLRSPAS